MKVFNHFSMLLFGHFVHCNDTTWDAMLWWDAILGMYHQPLSVVTSLFKIGPVPVRHASLD